jgi:glutamate-1-semialdehyde-2,1-aminomutase
MSLAREIPEIPRTLTRSMELKRKAENLIPAVSQTFSKGPTQYVQGIAPVYLQRGEGSHVWDVDGNEYIDYPMALGPIILGHNYPEVNDAVIKQLSEGVAFTLPHPLELEVAELLVDLIPCAEMVRFGKNGSDATAGAVRLARGYTGRDIVACCGYHGWQDWYIGSTTRNKGIPEAVRRLTIPFKYNDPASLEQIFKEHPNQVGAVIMEPVGVVEPRPDFLQEVRELATKYGAVLIFDEVITGFRMALGGAQEYFHVTPDIATFGKAMGNGFAASAIVGSKDIMKLFTEVYFSFTFGGDPLSLAATKATINVMKNRNVIAHVWEKGSMLRDGFNSLSKEYGLERQVTCTGFGPNTQATFQNPDESDSLLMKSLFQQECLKRGILFSGNHKVCFSHSTEDIERTLRVYRVAMAKLAEAMKSDNIKGQLEGAPVEPIFRRA